jgi:hypothetical protein
VNRHYNLGSTPAYTNFFSSVSSRECLSVGSGRYAGEYLYGPNSVSDVQIYDRPLTANEVRQLYHDVMDPALFKMPPPVISAEGDGLVLTWPSDSDYTYSILRSDTMPCDWQPVPGYEEIEATPPANYATIPLDTAPTGWFRIQATRQPGKKSK